MSQKPAPDRNTPEIYSESVVIFTSPEESASPHTPSSLTGRFGRSLIRGGRLACTMTVIGLIAWGASRFYADWKDIQKTQRAIADNQPIGYVNIFRNVSLARRPPDWRHVKDGRLWLWAGWDSERKQHEWFNFPAEDLAGISLDYVHNGRDVIMAIDQTVTESGGGFCWDRMSDGTSVYPFEMEGSHRAYPIRVLENVEVINERLDGKPLLIQYATFAPGDQAVTVYEADHRGKTVRMALSGYYLRQRHLMFDRDTESLWIAETDGVHCLAGPLKGAVLPVRSRPGPVAWSDWRDAHPNGELVIGADRPQPIANKIPPMLRTVSPSPAK